MQRLIKYIVVKARTTEELEKEVTEKLEEGFTVVGGIFAGNGLEVGIFFQAMIYKELS